MNSIKLIRILATVLALPAISILCSPQAQAAAFTYGNIVVLQEGDGVTGLSTTSAPIAVLEFTPAGGLVQTITIPSAGGNRLVQSSVSASEGFITRSADNHLVTFVGYDADVGVSNVPTTLAVNTNRCWGQLDLNGNYTRGASGLYNPPNTNAFSGANIRSSVSDGTSYWMSGTAFPTANQEGIWYSAAGASWIPIITSANVNSRVTKIFNGKLYYSVAGSISAFTGLPASATTATATGIASTSIYDFAINGAGNVAYVCDDSALASGGGIQKWTNNGATWLKAFTFSATNGLTAGCRGLAVDFSGVNPVIFATTADTQTKVIEITDTSTLTARSDTNDQAFTVTIAGANYAYRGVALAPGIQTSGAPTIIGVSPSAIGNILGSSAAFSVTANGTTPFGYQWYKEIVGTSTNAIPNATNAFLIFPSATTNDTANYQVVVSNSTAFTATSAVVSLIITSAPPTISSIAPLSTNAYAGTMASFTVTASGTLPLSYQWFKETATSTNPISYGTAATLTLSNVLAADGVNYQVLVMATGSAMVATSSVVSLTVTGDPHVAVQPASTYGLYKGTAQFAVGVIGTSQVTYRWYYSDTSGNIIAPVADGAMSDTSVVSGSSTSTLSIANLQAGDPTNFVVVATNVYGSVTSSVASLIAPINLAGSPLAFWDFNGPEFTNYVINPNTINNPAPFLGAGTAQAVGSCYNPPYPPNPADNTHSPFSGSVDNNNGSGFEGYPAYVYPPSVVDPPGHNPPFSWGTSTYPATGSNKLNGVQFNVSTVGAKNITVSYESRVSATASDYERLQYTTNGTDWIDYPSSSTFGGIGTTYLLYSNNLTGFPGVANNPNFGVRIVTELQSTATYGISANTNYLGTANTYGPSGTVTYDVVTFFGDAITNNNAPPVISGLMDTNMTDYVPTNIAFTVTDDSTSPNLCTYHAESLNPSGFNATFTFGGSGMNRTLTITPQAIQQSLAAAPILVTVTDGNGDTAAAWFLLSVSSINLPPTNSLTSLSVTNILANKSITIPFHVGDDRTAVGGLSYSVASDNNTLIPNGNIVVTGQGTANPSVTITPAANQLGAGLVSVTVADNDAQAAKSTTANFIVLVRPNTNVVAIDYFDYDTPGALDVVSAGYWNHLSGGFHQLQVGNESGANAAKVDSASGITENVQAALLGAPYLRNSGATLYSSFIINMNPSMNPLFMPHADGSYFAMFNNNTVSPLNTASVEGCVVAATNGAAPGYYRLGIGNAVAATALTAEMFPMDLSPGTSYIVVTALTLSNGFSTIWINPGDQSSPSVTDTTVAVGATNDIVNYEFRTSGQPNAGLAYVSYLKIGTTFDSVFPNLHVQPAGTKVIVNWSDPTLGLQSTTNLMIPFTDVPGATPPYTNNVSPSGSTFYRFGQ